jgi:hypothetical protein
VYWLLAVWCIVGLWPLRGFAAADSICALVKIEIEQVLTLERQAFDARMAITNHLDTISLQDVNVNVLFTDELGNSVLASSDPDNTAASFFIQVDSLSNIGNVSGTGSVLPNTTAEVHWLIIPAPGAGGDVLTGKRYDVGAVLAYTQNGVAQEVEVAPDLIFVKPLPGLTLDYFLTEDVVADDAFTPAIEPAEPFTLGVRVTNSGFGPATGLSIDTAQPEIVENELGLLIDFRIVAGEIDDQPAVPSLLLDFGDIEPGQSRVGRWRMETTLSGKFIDFSAGFSHADELGGALTSVLDAVNTHLLVRNVRVDLAGRDRVRDFLAKDTDVLRVYESEGLDSQVLNQSAQAGLGNVGVDRYELTMPATPGFAFAQVTDPYGGSRPLVAAYRSDGRTLPVENAWRSKSRVGSGPWSYHLNLFDFSTASFYTLVFGNTPPGNRAPEIQFIADQSVPIGTRLGFFVEASDPDGTLPVLSAASLPAGASFLFDSSGNALVRHLFDWTPRSGQNGPHEVTFTADDGALTASRTVAIRVTSPEDTDGDGMDDAWELLHFGTLARDGSGDLDGDGVADLDEFRNDTDPTVADLPNVPAIDEPQDGSRAASRQPLLRVFNSTHDPRSVVTYDFELYADAALSERSAAATVAEQTDTTAWQVDLLLDDNRRYRWRVRTCNETLCSDWVYAAFFVDTVNDPPGPFHISSPQFGTDVSVLQPLLTVTNSLDPDEEPVTYRFEVYLDSISGSPVTASGAVAAGADGTTSWQVDTALQESAAYFWQVVVTDPHGAQTSVSEAGSFFVNTFNSPPSEPAILYPAPGAQITALSVELTVANAADPEEEPVSYRFELDTAQTFDSPQKRTSADIDAGADGTTRWHVGELEENVRYYWRVNASDGLANSAWVTSTFFVNVANDPPPAPQVLNPAYGAWVDTRRPSLAVAPVSDPDGDVLTYRFEVSEAQSFAVLSAEVRIGETVWAVNSDLNDNQWYYWRILARDPHGLESAWSHGYFFVNENGVDDPPLLTLTQPASNVVISDGTVRIAWEDTDPDSNAVLDLYYEADAPGTGGVPIVTGLAEDPDGDLEDAYLWDIGGLPPGEYYIFGRISDATSAAISYAPGSVSVGALHAGTVSITVAGDPVTGEGGAGTTLQLVLDSPPTNAVKIPISSGDATEGQVDIKSGKLVFTPGKWDRPQTVDVYGVDDCLVDGDIAYHILIGPIESDDPDYDGVDPDDVLLTNLDDESAATHPTLAICGITRVSKKRIDANTTEYKDQAELANSGAALNGVAATASSRVSAIQVIDANLEFGSVAADATALSLDTIGIRHDPDFPFDASMLDWAIDAVPP